MRRRLRVHLLVEGVFWTLTAVLLAAAISLALDRIWRFNLSTRLALLVLAGAAIVAVVVRRLVRPLSLPLADLDLAELVNRRAPGVGQQICNVLQLPELLKSERYASPALVEAAVAECASRWIGSIWPQRSTRRAAASCWRFAEPGFCWPSGSGCCGRRRPSCGHAAGWPDRKSVGRKIPT